MPTSSGPTTREIEAVMGPLLDKMEAVVSACRVNDWVPSWGHVDSRHGPGDFLDADQPLPEDVRMSAHQRLSRPLDCADVQALFDAALPVLGAGLPDFDPTFHRIVLHVCVAARSTQFHLDIEGICHSCGCARGSLLSRLGPSLRAQARIGLTTARNLFYIEGGTVWVGEPGQMPYGIKTKKHFSNEKAAIIGADSAAGALRRLDALTGGLPAAMRAHPESLLSLVHPLSDADVLRAAWGGTAPEGLAPGPAVRPCSHNFLPAAA